MNTARERFPVALSEAEAARRLAADGPNSLPDQRRRGWAAIAGEAAREPMFLLLIGAALLYPLLGEPRESMFLPAAAELMRFSPPPPAWIAASAGAALLMLAGIELLRRR